MTDRWRGVWVAGALGAALVLLLHVVAGCGDGGRSPSPDAMVDSGGGFDGATDAPAFDATPPPDVSLADVATD